MNKILSATALLLTLGSSLVLLPAAHADQDMKMDKQASMEKDMNMDKSMAGDMKKETMSMEMINDNKMGDKMMKDEKHDKKM